MQRYQAAMATRLTGTKTVPQKGTRAGGGPGFPGPNGKGPRGNGWKGGDEPKRRLSGAAYRITMWVVLAAILMMFAALSLTFLFLSAGHNWQPVLMPRMFYLSTAIILASSYALERAKRSLRLGQQLHSFRWAGMTLLLGVIFLSCQLLGWRELRAQGLYFSGQPHSSFFYFFTGVHGVHLLGGIAALVYLLTRMRRKLAPLSEKTEVTAQVVSIYWHTMDGVWLWLFTLLLIWK
ncbi:MAG TPA: cytochrome c oxidase subunit 3 [Pyrinomonadaceae bacterium]